VDAYASWTLFFIFVSILILLSGVVLLTHKKPESASTQREANMALNVVSGRQIPRTADGKTEEHEDVDTEDQGEDSGQVWDVGEASDEEDENVAPTPRPQNLAEAGRGEEGEHLMTVSADDGDDIRSHTAASDRRPQTHRRSTSSVMRLDNNDEGRDDGDEDEDGFGEFAG
jgi:magnesium transporter